MTPLNLITWVGAIALCIVIAALAVSIVVSVVRGIVHPKPTAAKRDQAPPPAPTSAATVLPPVNVNPGRRRP